MAAQAPRELVLAKVESDILRNIFQYFSTKVGARAHCLRGALLPESHTLIPFTFVVQVLGIKVETKVQCVGVKCGLCLLSPLGWAGRELQGQQPGDARWGSLLPVLGDSFQGHRTGARPHSPWSSRPSRGQDGGLDGGWTGGWQKDF